MTIIDGLIWANMKPVELLLPAEASETKHAQYLKCYFLNSLFFQALHHCDDPHKTGISCTSEQPLLAGAQQLSSAYTELK